jgi:hypothetical protein
VVRSYRLASLLVLAAAGSCGAPGAVMAPTIPGSPVPPSSAAPPVSAATAAVVPAPLALLFAADAQGNGSFATAWPTSYASASR